MAVLERMRERMRESMAAYLYSSAAFIGDKVVTMSGHQPADVLALAQAHYCSGDYRRALHLVRTELERTNAWPGSGYSSHVAGSAGGKETEGEGAHTTWSLYLAAKCLEKREEWEACLAVLGVLSTSACLEPQLGGEVANVAHPGDPVQLSSGLSLLRGRAFEAAGNLPRATYWYNAALQVDPFCYEAFERLINRHMLSAQQELDLVASLRLEQEDEWLRQYYSCRIKLYGREEEVGTTLSLLDKELSSPRREESNTEATPAGTNGTTRTAAAGAKGGLAREGSKTREDLHAGLHALGIPLLERVRMGSVEEQDARGAATGAGLRDVEMEENAILDRRRCTQGSLATLALEPSPVHNADVAACRAELLFLCGRYSASYDVSKRILQMDPYHLACVPTHLAAALHLGRNNDLFRTAHRLAQEYPKSGLAWFAVACYYMSTGQYDQARRFFSKATTAEPTFAPAWLGFGHAYAAQDETDQAMVAYRTAARRFTGCHVPLLCIGIEYQKSNNLPLAEHFLEDALRKCPDDPLIHNELGVVAYRNCNFEAAQKYFESALSLVPDASSACWESTLVNLGHTHRKQGALNKALVLYERALSICPHTASTFTAIAYTLHLQGDILGAIEWYHKALGLRPDDSLAAEMLSVALEEDCDSLIKGA